MITRRAENADATEAQKIVSLVSKEPASAGALALATVEEDALPV
jgi:hypothetical protein